ncbi:MAG: type II secretion system protein [Acidimicrobiales bacterium]
MVCPPRKREGGSGRSDRGVTLIELIATMALTLIVLALVSPALATVMSASSSVRATSKSVAQARLAVEDLTTEVGSAAQICLPTQMTDTGPTVLSGFALRAETLAFGGDEWIQFWIDPVSGDLVEQQWPTTWATGDPVAPPTVIATGVVNTSQSPPFALLPSATGSPGAVEVSLAIATAHVPASPEVSITSQVAALDTPYAPSLPAQPCATTKD